MIIDHLATRRVQARGVPTTDHLATSFRGKIGAKGIDGQLELFLLACRVNGLSPETSKSYFYHIGGFVRFCHSLGIHDAKRVTSTHVRLALADYQTGHKPKSRQDYCKAVRRFFNWLVEEEVIDEMASPMRHVKNPKVEETLIAPFSKGDLDRLMLLSSESDFRSVRNRALILVFFDTGLRLKEVSGMKVTDVDFDMETIKVMGKGSKQRIVRIGFITQKALLKYLLMRDDQQDAVWLSQDRRPMSRLGIQTAIKRLCRRAEITDARGSPHTFRHTSALSALRNGMDEFSLQLMLGHSTRDMTKRYLKSLGGDDVIRAHKKASPVDNMAWLK